MSLLFMGYGRRRYTRRSYRRAYKTQRYSNETMSGVIDIPLGAIAPDKAGVLVVSTELQAMRKAKNFKLTMYTDPDVKDIFYFAVVYVPQGMEPSALNTGTNLTPVSLYEPNQYVIMSGMLQPGGNNIFYSRLARNLNSGDAIGIQVRTAAKTSAPLTIPYTFNYAITY